MFQTILVSSLLALPFAPQPGALAPLAPDSGVAKSADEVRFPTASGPLALAQGEQGVSITLAELLARYAKVTNAVITHDESTGAALRDRMLRIDRDLEVAVDEVSTIVESFLAHAGFVCTLASTEGTTLMRVEHIFGDNRSMIRTRAVLVDESQVDEIARHPATLVTMTLELPNIDVRQLSNTLRTLVTDANTQQILPAGNANALVLVGTGAWVAGHVRSLRALDDSLSAARAAAVPEVEVVRLQHGNAADVAGIMAVVFDLGGNGQQGDVAPGAPAPPRPMVVHDERTNSLVLRGTEADLERFRALIAALDQPVD